MTEELIVDGNNMALISGSIDSKPFYDTFLKITSMSEVFQGSSLFQLSWNDVKNSSFTVFCSNDCVVIVAVWEYAGRRDNLIDTLQGDGWVLKKDQQIKWEKVGEYGKTKAVFSKTVQSNHSLSFSKPEKSLPISVFVVQGKLSIHYHIFLYS